MLNIEDIISSSEICREKYLADVYRYNNKIKSISGANNTIHTVMFNVIGMRILTTNQKFTIK